MIHRINVFILSIIIAFAPAYSFAFNTVKFLDAIENARKITGGVVADFKFKDAAGKAYIATQKTMTPQQLAKVAKKRILCGTLITIIACGIGVAALEDMLTSDGWIIDKEGNRIYKVEQHPNNGKWLWSDYKGVWYPSINTAAQKHVEQRWNCDTCNKNYYAELTAVNNNSTDNVCRGDFGAIVYHKDGKVFSDTGANGGNAIQCKLNPNPPDTNERDITDSEIADKIKDLTLTDLVSLAGSPDMDSEPHEPLKNIANEAQQQNPDTCKTGTKLDPTTKECVPNKGKVDPETGDLELPEFCKWVPTAICEWYYDTKPWLKNTSEETTKSREELEKQTLDNKTFYQKVTDFFDWTQTPPDESTESTNVSVSKRDVEDYGIDMGTTFNTTRFSVNDQCPPPVTTSINLNGTHSFTLSLEPVCNILSTIKPVMIGCGYLYAAFIVTGAARE